MSVDMSSDARAMAHGLMRTRLVERARWLFRRRRHRRCCRRGEGEGRSSNGSVACLGVGLAACVVFGGLVFSTLPFCTAGVDVVREFVFERAGAKVAVTYTVEYGSRAQAKRDPIGLV